MSKVHNFDDSKLIDGPATFSILQEVVNERIRQDAKWGQQNPPDGTGHGVYPLYVYLSSLENYNAEKLAEVFTKSTDNKFRAGAGSWRDILLEEVFEALAESDPGTLSTELVQVAAVATAWVEAIDRRANG